MIQKIFSIKTIAGNTERNTCTWIDWCQARQTSLGETSEYSPTVYCGVLWLASSQMSPV